MQVVEPEPDESPAADAIEDNSSGGEEPENEPEEVEGNGYESGSTLVLGEYVPSVRGDDMSEDSDEVPPPLENGTCESPVEPHKEELEPAPSTSTSASDHDGKSPLEESPVPSVASKFQTPQGKDLKHEDLFDTPEVGNMSQSIPRAELVEMCIALMQYFGDHHPEILKFFGFNQVATLWRYFLG